MRSSISALVLLVAGCGADAPSLQAPPDALARVDAGGREGGVDGAPRAVEPVEAPPVPTCGPDRLTATLTSSAGEVVASERWLASPAEAHGALFTDGPGGLWLSSPDAIATGAPTGASVVIALGGPEPRAYCGEAMVTWDARARAVALALDAVARWPSCADGEPIDGQVEVCSDALRVGCEGHFTSARSTVEGLPLSAPLEAYRFGGPRGGPYTFQLGDLSGVGGARGGYAYSARDRALYCVGSVVHSGGGVAAARLVISGFRRLGSCEDAEPLPGATLTACAGDDPR